MTYLIREKATNNNYAFMDVHGIMQPSMCRGVKFYQFKTKAGAQRAINNLLKIGARNAKSIAENFEIIEVC